MWIVFGLLSVLGLAVYKTAIKFISTGFSPILLMTITSFFYFGQSPFFFTKKRLLFLI